MSGELFIENSLTLILPKTEKLLKVTHVKFSSSVPYQWSRSCILHI